MSAVSAADFVVVVAGLTPQDEGEEYTLAADRNTNCVTSGACLPLDAKQQSSTYHGIQNKLIQQVAASGKPMVVVLEGGSVIDMPWLSQVPAVVMAWYPGQRGGEALGDLLWGEVNGASYNFGGKLPFTWGHEMQYGDPFDSPGRHDGLRLLRRLPLLRPKPHHAGVSVRGRAQLHDVRALQPAARVQQHEPGGGVARRRQRQEHRHGRRRRDRDGLRVVPQHDGAGGRPRSSKASRA